ncbi:TMV resistance protein N-like [Trifolium medium]|uniref:TMV resistance protein N-like n=1 Tax=Trifolium medium TaxID=97028 RepID=A0A392MSV7_9FABA|nr:TMV resistance protein N-like [Trifolium medium]
MSYMSSLSVEDLDNVVLTTRQLNSTTSPIPSFRDEDTLDSPDSRRKYDVFLSFRGEDTRSSFTSHLYFTLQTSGIIVFKDDHSLQRGDPIPTSLLRGIEDSRISVIVFSKNYANSKWCMNELVKIMECQRTIGHRVLPVFYNVDPSEIRCQTGEFGKSFQNLLNRIVPEDELMAVKWRDALREAGGLAGFLVLNFRFFILRSYLHFK